MEKRTTLVSVDLETSGTLLGKSPILSIGACRAERRWDQEWGRLKELLGGPPGRILEEPDLFYCEIAPKEEEYWSEDSVQYHGLTQAHLAAHGLPSDEVLGRFIRWIHALEGADATYRLVSHNASFDWAHLSVAFVRQGVDDPFDPFPVCTKNLARARFRAQGEEMSGQTVLGEVLGLPPHLGKHHGLADALSQALLYQRLIAV